MALLLRRCSLTLLLRRSLALLLRWCSLTLLLRRNLVLLLRRFCLVACLHSRRRPDIAIRGKRLAYGQVGWPAMVNAGKLCPVRAGNMLILHLSSHGRGVRFVAGRQFGWSGANLQSAGTARKADSRSATAALCDGAVVDVMHH